MIPTYVPNRFSDFSLSDVLYTTPWVQVTDARLECFMSSDTDTYTYGSGRGVRTYTPVGYSWLVAGVQVALNEHGSNYNVCFLNRYDDAQMSLGWHADDTPGMDHDHPIAVVSFGESREIWWRSYGQTGVIPRSQRQLLEHGSLFVMPPGMQRTHQHRIPKCDHSVNTRVSLTYRHYVKS